MAIRRKVYILSAVSPDMLDKMLFVVEQKPWRYFIVY